MGIRKVGGENLCGTCVRKCVRKGFKRYKIGQTEIIGLLVIVLILLFLAVIYIRFSISKPKSMLPEIRKNIEISNLIGATVKYRAGGTIFIESVEDCYEQGAGSGGCAAVIGFLERVFGAVLRPGQGYKFIIRAENREILALGGCDRGIIGNYVFTKNNVFYEASLRLC